MYKKLLFCILLEFMTSSFAFGQNCFHNKLSNEFIFKTEINRIKNEEGWDSCIVKIDIIKTASKQKVQSIDFTSSYFLSDFNDCESGRSYSTGINKDIDAPDNDYGDLVVTDFNFDNKEDFAIKSNSGGNGGPSYNFYIQSNGIFVLDEFLSETMIYFPASFNIQNKTLTTIVHANAYQMGETTFKLHVPSNKWKRVKHRLLTVNEE